jgi:hypothetical protein
VSLKTTKTAVPFTTLIPIDKRDKIFDDLDKFRDYCRFEGKVFNEKDLYKEGTLSWDAYKKWQGWMRAKTRNGGKDFVQRPRKKFNRSN